MRDRSVLLITGTSRGIGGFLARHYLATGYDVVGCSRRPAEFSDPGYRHICADVTSEADVKRLMREIRTEYGKLDGLVNNAGIASMNHALLTPLGTVQKILATNLVGTFLVSREAAKLMKVGGRGRIVNFSTVAVPFHLEGEAAYVASKAAVVALTQVLAREFAGFGITVNAVGPTPIDTDLTRGVPPAKIQSLMERQAIARPGTFEDVANVVDFFLQDTSSFVSGQVIYLGGVS